MTSAQLAAVVKGIAPAIKDAIAAAAASLEARLAALEAREPIAGKDGAPGPPGERGPAGRDGVGFDDLEFDFDGERTCVFKFTKGERVVEKTVKLATVLDRGVFTAGKAYEKGDAVTYNGSIWIAQKETGEQPGTSKAWRLSVKQGRDGRNGKDGERGPEGPQGRPGLDLTQTDSGGNKWR